MPKITLLKHPCPLDSRTCNEIRKMYADAVGEVGEDEVTYVATRLPKVIRRLSFASEPWEHGLAQLATILAEHIDGVLYASDSPTSERERLIVAALFYLCNPYDYIPDYKPGIGFSDDVLVLNECVTRLSSIDEQLTSRILRSFQEPSRAYRRDAVDEYPGSTRDILE